MVEVAKPFIEAVDRGEELVAIAKVVLSELGGGVTGLLQHFGKRRVFLLDAARGARNADRRQAGAYRHLSGHEGGAAGRAARLAVVISEDYSLFGDAVDIGCLTHHSV